MKLLRHLFLFFAVVTFSCDAQITINGSGAPVKNGSGVIVKSGGDPTVSTTGYVVFAAMGDSFVAGSNNTTGAGPDATGKGYYFRTSDNTIQPITTTDIPGASDGSPWPQFCIDYYNATGYKVVIVPNGVGGTKFFDTWDGASGTYTGARTDANDALTAVGNGISKLRGVLVICGINDAKGGDDLNTINTKIGNFYTALGADFPGVPIYQAMLGTATTGANRHPQVRGFIREYAITNPNVNIVCTLAPFEAYGYYGADGIHLVQTGNNVLGSKFNSYMQLDATKNKFARTIVNSYYSSMSSELTNVNTWMTTMGTQYNDLVSLTWCKVPDRKDLYNDWGLLTVPTDDGFDFTANSFITTDPTGSKSIRMAISPQNVTYRYTSTDLGIGAATVDRKGAFGTSTKYLMGASSGSNVIGLAETSTGVMQYFIYENGTSATGTGGFADNTEYAVDYFGGTKSRVVNGTVTQTESITPGTALTSGVEVGARYTAGPTLFLNTEIRYFFWYKASSWNRATFNSAMTTLNSSW